MRRVCSRRVRTLSAVQRRSRFPRTCYDTVVKRFFSGPSPPSPPPPPPRTNRETSGLIKIRDANTCRVKTRCFFPSPQPLPTPRYMYVFFIFLFVCFFFYRRRVRRACVCVYALRDWVQLFNVQKRAREGGGGHTAVYTETSETAALHAFRARINNRLLAARATITRRHIDRYCLFVLSFCFS